jgi:GAF domain-containing protein
MNLFIAIGVLVGVADVLIEVYIPYQRQSLPAFQNLIYFVLAFLFLALGYFIFRQFRDYSVRTKFLVSILLVSGLSVAVIGYFTYTRLQQSQSFLTGDLQTAVQQQTNQKLNDTAQSEANYADQTLLAVSNDVETLANYSATLYSRSLILETGSYWDGHTQLIKMAEGQYGNSKSDVASIFIPNTVLLDDSLIAELNTMAYLDFVVPATMKSDQTIIAMYFISKEGATTYYPNIGLAESVPPGFDLRTQPFYTIATPKNDPERKVAWTPPYQDPAGTGLIVTSSAPVYDHEGQFRGVLAADVQLAKISEQIGVIRVGQTGFAFLIDPAGHLIAIHEASTNAFRIFGLNYEAVPVNETPKQTVLNRGPADLQEITRLMVAGESGLKKTTIDKIQYYVAYAPLPTIGYSLGLIVPVTELDAPYLLATKNMDNTTRTTLNLSIIILGVMLVVVTGISIFLSQFISRPLVELTQVAGKISQGDLNTQARAETQDEIGVLARTFNAMTAQLRELIGSLEQRVEERTTALSRKTSQLQAATHVARQAAAIKDSAILVNDAVRLISDQFGFYHAGLFLLDEHNEYALLQAASSEGGQRMLARGHRLRVGGQGIVGFAAAQKRPRIALDTGTDAAYFDNPDLPETRSEAALPLIVRDRVIGVLDIQSEKSNAFTQEDIEILQTLTDQLALAIENARLFSELDAIVQQLEQTAAKRTYQSWSAFSKRRLPIYQYTPMGVQTVGAVPEPREDTGTLVVPIILRGRNIGKIHLKRKGAASGWMEQEQVMVQEVAAQVGLALENARLLEDAQTRASRERSIGEISARIGSAFDVDSVLRTTAQEIGKALGDAEVQVRLRGGDETLPVMLRGGGNGRDKQ